LPTMERRNVWKSPVDANYGNHAMNRVREQNGCRTVLNCVITLVHISPACVPLTQGLSNRGDMKPRSRLAVSEVAVDYSGGEKPLVRLKIWTNTRLLGKVEWHNPSRGAIQAPERTIRWGLALVGWSKRRGEGVDAVVAKAGAPHLAGTRAVLRGVDEIQTTEMHITLTTGTRLAEKRRFDRSWWTGSYRGGSKKTNVGRSAA